MLLVVNICFSQVSLYYDEVKYPPIAKQARIQGDVFIYFQIENGKLKLVSRVGHNLLVSAVLEHISRFEYASDGKYYIYHEFIILPMQEKTITINRDINLKIFKIKRKPLVKKIYDETIPKVDKYMFDVNGNVMIGSTTVDAGFLQINKVKSRPKLLKIFYIMFGK